MTKLVKTDHAIVPATSLAGKVEEALGGGKLAPLSTLAIREDEIMAVLRDIEAGTVKVSRRMQGDWHNTDNGWSFLIFDDAGEWDYIEAVVAPDGRECDPWTFLKIRTDGLEGEAVEHAWEADPGFREYEKLREYEPPDLSKWPGWAYVSDDELAALGEARIDPAGPGIALTVEPLNPVLRVEGAREIVVDTETDKQALGRMFRPGVPATELSVSSVSSERLGEVTRILTSELDPGSDLKIKIPAFADRVSVGPSDIVLYFQDDENTILYSIDAALNGDSIPIASAATQITVRNYGNRKLSAKLTFRMAL